jgi:hypothetical protein
MWGVGPTLSTMAFPGAYPSNFPTVADGSNTPNPRDNLERVKGDLGLAARGVLYIKNRNRIGARLHMGFGLGGADMRNTALTIEYGQSILRQDNVNIFVGGGIGVGKLRFDQGDDGGDLRLNTYNTRVQIGAIFRDTRGRKNAADDRAYELALFATPLGWAGPETYEFGGKEFSDPESRSLFAGLTSDDDDDQVFKGSIYNPTIGIEATVFFGDFTPPNNRRNRNRNRR